MVYQEITPALSPMGGSSIPLGQCRPSRLLTESARTMRPPARSSKIARSRPGSREGGAYQGDVLVYCPPGTLYLQMFTIPGLVFSCDHFGPCWHRQARNVRHSRLDSPTVLLRGRALDFDLHRRDPGTLRHVHPGIASQLKRVDRISNYGSANAEIVFRDSVGYAVTNVVQGLVNACPATNRLLYGVDAQVHSSDLPRQFSGDGRLADPGQPAEDNQHFPIIEDSARSGCSPGYLCNSAGSTPVVREGHRYRTPCRHLAGNPVMAPGMEA
jgi:hypothetical protein